MSFKTINNTTPFSEGTDTHALVGHSSYSTTGTTSFSAIHTEVAGQEYMPFGAPATSSGPRRIGRDEFLGNENNGNAVGKDEEVPTGDMLLPLLVMAGCMILFKCISTIKNSRAMKKFFSLLVFSLLSVGTLVAQNNYLQDGDIVSISTDITNGGGGEGRRYLDNYAQTQNNVNDNCLWRLGITNGQYTFQSLSTNQYLSVYIPSDPQSARLVMAANPTSFSFIPTGDGGEQGKYLCGSFSHSFFYQPWNNTYAIYIARYWGQSFTADPWNANATLYIEKWEKKGGSGGPTGFFTPEKAEFTYAENESAATKQKTQVSFTLRSQIESYYECVTREEILLRRQTETINLSGVTPTFYWESSKNETSTLDLSKYNEPHTETGDRAMMLISNATTNGQTSSFYITPQGGSPMGLKQYIYSEGNTIQGIERWVDYADRVIAQYTYKGQTYTETMRVVRKSYHEEELPSLVFSINPVTYTFAQNAESVDINITPTHQHGRVLYNSDNQEIHKEYTEGPTPIPLTNNEWKLSISFSNNENEWLEGERNGDYKIKVTATENNTEAKRSSVLTGTFTKINGTDIHSGTFTIPLAQRYVEGGIQFHTKGTNGTDPQQVHTSERTIYYLPNEEIELRPAESGYSGYMRWYDYETGMDPYYNENPIDSTSWILSPRAASGAAFSAINTPQNNNTYKADGRSYGLYAINKAEGGVLNEDNPANPAPKIKGWNYTSIENASHTIACDMSAYRDYVIKDTTFANGEKRIQSITEPTLSYRQLFHLKPAEEIANKFAKLQEGQYLEEYHYQAPVGKTVLLATEFRFNKLRSHKSEMCYFYRGLDGELHRIESDTKWFVSTLQADGTYSAPAAHTPTYTSTMDYLVINSTAPQTQIYTLVLPAGTNNSTDIRIARFTVTFVPVRECGPTNEVLITPQRINSEFKRLATIDFNANTNHLPWDESSYGFVYTSGELATNTKYARGANQGVFPFYGEYMLTPQVNKDWARASAKTGNALYVDGTMEPGLVASISANTVICSGQTLYCSAWFCNPTPQAWNSEGNPIFRCNVQGRNIVEIVDGKTTYTPWTDVEAYFVGELPKNSGWQQINFPIVSAHNYDQTRVAIYNFATTNLGNDFMVDDITLYVSQLPIAAYQGKMACRSIDSNNTSAAAVLRIDYSMIEPGGDGFMYYQIYNNSYENGEGKPDGAPVVLAEESAYYHDNTYDHEHNNKKNEYGSVTIPDQHFDPEVYNADKNTLPKVAIYQSVSKFLDELVENKEEHGKAYVKTENNGVTKWLLYVAHIIPNTDKNEESLRKLYDRHSYSMRMAYTPGELEKPECNLQTPIHATQQTVFELRNSANNIVKQRDENGNLQKITDSNGQEQVVTRFFTHSIQNCANDLYFLDIKVINNLAVSTGANIDNLEAPIYADWLIGDSIDDIYGQVRPTDAEELKKYLKKAYAADSIFKLKHGGYTHGQVTTAIMYDMRRIPSDDNPNPNYYAKTFEELDPNAFLSPQNYTIVKYLHDHELLQMYTPTVHFYLASQDTARYWAFPIAETAKVVNDDKTIVLKDCNEPRWVTVSSQSSNYFLNITPLDKTEKTLHQRTQIPTVKVVAKNSNQIIIPVKEIADGKVTINDSTYAEDATITINLNLPSLPTGFEFYDIEQSKVRQKPSELLPGETYTMRVAFQEENGFNYPGDYSGAENACRIGFVFFNIEVVPNTLVWTPTGTSMNGWGKNENWKGWIDTNEDHKIDYNTELVEGFVPMDGTDVIIPNLQNPLIYPYIVPEDEHDHYPMTHYHDQHKCDKIYFAEGAHMNNQHLLEYKAAFVDMKLPQQGEWYMMSAPLQNMVSGDMFIPHEGTYTNGSIIAEPNPFMVSSFQGTRDNIAAYAFWTAFYNQSVKTWYEDGSAKESTSAEFQQSNGLGNLLPPGGGFQLLGFGPDAKSNDTLTIRLPKPDTEYESSSGRKVNVDKQKAHLLAFTPDKDGKMTIKLRNAIEGNSFIFGNPTMAFINMHDFLHDNESVLQHEFYRLSGSTWTAVNASTMSSSERFLAPMSAVKLVAKKNTKSLTITLKTSHLTLNNQYNPLSETIQQQKNDKHIQRQAPSQNETEVLPEMLTVYAFAKGNHARTILVVDNQANDYYVQGEDMLFISSGVEGNSTSVVETPVNMYTAAEKTPMMVDVRQGISQIPLAFLMAKNKKADTFELAFYLSPNWTRTCYLLDKATGQRRRIMNGSIFTLPMPGNHEERYIIEGPDEYIGSNANQDNTPTGVEQTQSYHPQSKKVIINGTLYIIRDNKTYTLTGLEVKL